MKLIFTIVLIAASFSVNAQVYDLVRSLTTHDANESFVPKLRDTTRSSSLDEFTHTGTMTVENGFVAMNTLSCVNGICVKEDKNREILLIFEDNKTVALLDDDAVFGSVQFSILSLSPTIILMATNQDGTVNVTEWAPR